MACSQADLLRQRSVQAATIAQAGQAVCQRHVAHGLVRVTQLSFRHHSLAQLTQDDEPEHREHPDQHHQHPAGFQQIATPGGDDRIPGQSCFHHQRVGGQGPVTVQTLGVVHDGLDFGDALVGIGQVTLENLAARQALADHGGNEGAPHQDCSAAGGQHQGTLVIDLEVAVVVDEVADLDRSQQNASEGAIWIVQAPGDGDDQVVG
ncbi:hypothetical protein D3C78_1276320 [compost metagenome]